jgi:hypothetical protein
MPTGRQFNWFQQNGLVLFMPRIQSSAEPNAAPRRTALHYFGWLNALTKTVDN